METLIEELSKLTITTPKVGKVINLIGEFSKLSLSEMGEEDISAVITRFEGLDLNTEEKSKVLELIRTAIRTLQSKPRCVPYIKYNEEVPLIF